MNFKKLGNTDLKVSTICLGTMTWGEQNSINDAFQQMDYAVDRGVNFFDTAELYAVPMKPETRGKTSQFIGEWFLKTKKRNKIILADKVVGASNMSWLRPGGEKACLNKKQIKFAVDRSLKDLKTDYIDLYQVHWPDRPSGPFSGALEYEHKNSDDSVGIDETLDVLNDLVQTGKVKHMTESLHRIHKVKYSPDGKVIAASASFIKGGRMDGAIMLFDSSTGKEVKQIEPAGFCVSLDFGPKGRYLAATAGRQSLDTVNIWDTITNKKIFSSQESGREIQSLAYGKKGRSILLSLTSGQSGKLVKLHLPPTGLPSDPINIPYFFLTSL